MGLLQEQMPRGRLESKMFSRDRCHRRKEKGGGIRQREEMNCDMDWAKPPPSGR